MVDLHEVVDGWTRGALEATEVIGAWPTAAFSAVAVVSITLFRRGRWKTVKI